MPLYDFKCEHCDQVKEVFRHMAEALDPLNCEECGQEMRRIYTPFGISNHFTAYRFGYPFEVHYNLFNSGIWESYYNQNSS